MLHPKQIFNPKTPEHQSRLAVLSPDTSHSRHIPLAEEVGGAAAEHVEVRVEPVDGTPIDELSLKEGNVPKATWKDPYGEGE